jgi:cyclophilin family peptidyl-prolyl cis-trans isomerase
MKKLKLLMLPLLFAGLVSFAQGSNPTVVLETNYGKIEVELYPKKAPLTVKNFLKYVENGHYNGTIFHRVIDNFMIQGGGFDPKFSEKKTESPIKNEAFNGLKNEEGTLAMARTSVVDSATAQFFINVRNNPHLNHRSKTNEGFGYAVFGKVKKGMSVVNRIKKSKTHRRGNYFDVPVEPIVIKSAKALKK